MLLMRVKTLDILFNNILVRCLCWTYPVGLAFIQWLRFAEGQWGYKNPPSKNSFQAPIQNTEISGLGLGGKFETSRSPLLNMWNLPVHVFFFFLKSHILLNPNNLFSQVNGKVRNLNVLLMRVNDSLSSWESYQYFAIHWYFCLQLQNHRRSAQLTCQCTHASYLNNDGKALEGFLRRLRFLKL